jgi:hypothetical protein
MSRIQRRLEGLQSAAEELRQREEVVRAIDELRQRMFEKYGEMPDSVELVRDDRAR